MREVDYLIVGFGLAGMSLAHCLEKNNKSFVVFEDASQNSSKVAGGVYNPVILKRFTPVWKGVEQLKIALPFYKELEEKFQNKYIFEFDTYRIFKSVEEQNNWFSASDKSLLSPFMDDTIIHKKHAGIFGDYGYGRLKNTGRVKTSILLQDYAEFLNGDDKIFSESFEYSQLKFINEKVVYKDILAEKVVFCEGYGLHKNPFFSYLPLNEAKGELLTIHAPDLNVDFLIKAAVFVLPLGDDLYKVGATFNWKDKTSEPTHDGRKELVEKLATVIDVPYKIVAQFAGIRPTVIDRRPLVGRHPNHKNLYVLNGLGTRGVMIAPTVSSQLFDSIENSQLLDADCDIKRFEGKYFKN